MTINDLIADIHSRINPAYADVPDGEISSAIVACQIKWEFERMERT